MEDEVRGGSIFQSRKARSSFDKVSHLSRNAVAFFSLITNIIRFSLVRLAALSELTNDPVDVRPFHRRSKTKRTKPDPLVAVATIFHISNTYELLSFLFPLFPRQIHALHETLGKINFWTTPPRAVRHDTQGKKTVLNRLLARYTPWLNFPLEFFFLLFFTVWWFRTNLIREIRVFM